MHCVVKSTLTWNNLFSYSQEMNINLLANPPQPAVIPEVQIRFQLQRVHLQKSALIQIFLYMVWKALTNPLPQDTKYH